MSNYLKLLRPRQWIKNFFVFGALIFSSSFTDPHKILLSILAFILFCLTSSSVYILNDIVDLEKDRLHPKKKYRPIASGKVSVKSSIILMVSIILLVIITSFILNKLITLFLALYLINNLLYSFKLKHMILIDVLSISIGFILRVVTGGIAISVKLSPWILMCTLFISLFLGFEKRKAEITVLGNTSGNHRSILDNYSLELLDQLTTISTACTLVFYALYSVLAYENVPMYITNIFVIYGMFRYKYITDMGTEGGSPTEAVLTDKGIIIDVLLWIITSIIILFMR